MKRNMSLAMVVALSLQLLSHTVVFGQAASEDREKSKKENPALAALRKDAQEIFCYIVEDGKRKKVELQPGPLYVYKERIRDIKKGSAWVWGGKGRPVAFLSMANFQGSRLYEFDSLATVPLDVEFGSGASWNPPPNWKPQPVDGASSPAKNRRLRMIQMRSLARKFSAHEIDHYEGGKRYNLRLVPQPIYRYSSESEESLDGAVFVFSREGDLEILLVIDAVKAEDGTTQWMYDCYPCSANELIVEFGRKMAWYRKNLSSFAAATPRSGYHIYQRALRADEK